MAASSSLSRRFGRLLKWIVLVLSGAFVLLIGGLLVWFSVPYGHLMPEAEQALVSDDQITVTTRGWIAFFPTANAPATGMIFYPGARVQAEAYAPLARQIAEAGHLAVIVYPPLHMALLNTNAAAAVMDNYSAIQHWAVGGHSLGGVAASIFATANLETVDGLVLLASFPADDVLASTELQVVSIYGENDGLATVEDIQKSASRLPASAQFVEIIGGNHSQFGYYGFQDGDGAAAISYDEQTQQTAAAIIDLLNHLVDAAP